MPLGAKFTITAHNKYLADAIAKNKVQNVDLTAEFAAPQINLSICSDVTAITAPGVIEREVLVPFTPTFLLENPTVDSQRAILAGFCKSQFTALAPVVVTVGLLIEDVSCP